MYALSVNVFVLFCFVLFFFIKATSPCSQNLVHPVANIRKDKT